MRRHSVFGLAVVTAALAACGGDGGTAETTTTAASPGASATTTTAASGSAGTGSGSATLTVGDQVFTFDNYYCFSGEDTGNDRVSFSSGATGDFEGTRVQLDASIQDPDEQGRVEGEGTIQSVTVNDIEDFENPAVGLEAVSGFIGAPAFTISVEGGRVTAEALFDDTTTDEIEEIPGTLEATCGA